MWPSMLTTPRTQTGDRDESDPIGGGLTRPRQDAAGPASRASLRRLSCHGTIEAADWSSGGAEAGALGAGFNCAQPDRAI